MDSMKNRKPVHLVCPKCRYEFEYNMAKYDDQIRKLGEEIRSIMDQIRIRKLTSNTTSKEYKDWLWKASEALRHKQVEVAELKGFRKIANVAAKATELELFAEVVRENVSRETYVAWHEQAESMMQYDTYDTAVQRHNNFSGV